MSELRPDSHLLEDTLDFRSLKLKCSLIEMGNGLWHTETCTQITKDRQLKTIKHVQSQAQGQFVAHAHKKPKYIWYCLTELH